MSRIRIVCIGGGAASFFFAANAGRANPNAQITILEQGKSVLGKVRISGGGRCNVTHHCFEPDALIEHYPRGKKELLGPFYRFGPRDTITWFESRGVKLKTEQDGRMFPVTDDSETIIRCLMNACEQSGVEIRTRAKVTNIKVGSDSYSVELLDGTSLGTDFLFVAPGSSNQMWQVLGHLGHRLVKPVPSLFTFQISDLRLHDLSGVSVPMVELGASEIGVESNGPILITHRGLSGPAVLKMSAFGAREFAKIDYRFELKVDWIPNIDFKEIRSWRESSGKKLLGNHHLTGLPKRLHQQLVDIDGLDPQKKLASVSNKELELLRSVLKECKFYVTGQNRFKEEFVTAGGVELSEIDMSTFESKVLSNMFMAGEVLNIDAVTGGFNFQAAWTGAYLAAEAVTNRINQNNIH